MQDSADGCLADRSRAPSLSGEARRFDPIADSEDQCRGLGGRVLVRACLVD